MPTSLNLDLSTTVPQVVAMSDIMAGTTLEDLEYSDEEDEMESDEDDIDKVGALLGRITVNIWRANSREL